MKKIINWIATLAIAVFFALGIKLTLASYFTNTANWIAWIGAIGCFMIAIIFTVILIKSIQSND